MNHHGAEKEFITAFWQIYEHKSLEKISIKELCIKAGYNRTTFYVYYQNIYDLLDKAVDDLLSPVIEQIYEIDDLESLLKGNLIRPLFLKFFPQRSGYIEIIFKRNQYYILTEKIKSRLLDFIKAQLKNDLKNIEIILEYQISAIIGVISYWYKSEKKMTEEELIKIIYEISARGIFSLLTESLSDKRQ